VTTRVSSETPRFPGLTDVDADYLREWEARHSVRLHRLTDPVDFVVKGVGEMYGLQLRTRGAWVADLYLRRCPSPLTLLLERLTPGVKIAAARLDELWHDSTHGTVDRDVQLQVERRFGPDLELSTRTALEESLQARREAQS
jgi:hypothetical protein